MKALLLKDVKRVEVVEVSDPVIQRGHVLVKVKSVGICGTDIAMYRGKLKPSKMPIVPGHEVAGVVDDVGVGVSRDLVGKRVTFEINITCGSCFFCRTGLYTHCVSRKAIGIDVDGGMCEYIAVPANNIHVIEDVDFDEGVLIEPLAASLRAISYLPPGVGHRAAVLGQGPLGYLMTQVLKVYGFDVTVFGTRWERLKYFKDVVDSVYNLNEIDVVEEARKMTGYGFDVVVEATGSPLGLEIALKIVRPRGVILAKSTHGESVSFDYTSMVVKEVMIVPSRCGTFVEWRRAIDLVRRGLVRARNIITHKFSLGDGAKAFETADRKEGMKVVVNP